MAGAEFDGQATVPVRRDSLAGGRRSGRDERARMPATRVPGAVRLWREVYDLRACVIQQAVGAGGDKKRILKTIVAINVFYDKLKIDAESRFIRDNGII